MSEVFRVVAVGTGFLLIFAAAELWRRYGNPPVEWSRKFVHFTGGLLVLAFPWIFTSRWSVLVLVSVFSVLIWGTRRAGLLRSVHGVTRESHGSLFYPLAVVILFAISYDQPAFYLASALALVVSDTAAALLGSTYGRTRYDVEQDRRSIEGSVSFFLVTFLAVHVTLLLLTEVDRSVSVLVAVQVASVVTLFEGISLHGSDNLLVPLATYHLLLRLTPESPAVIAGHTGVLITILVLLSLLARRSRLMKTSGVMAASLFFYLVFSLGGPEWMLAPALGLVGIAGMRAYMGRTRSYFAGTRAYITGMRESKGASGPLPTAEFQVLATFYATVVPILLLIAHDLVTTLDGVPLWLEPCEAFVGPFTGAVVAQFAIVAATQLKPFGVAGRLPPPLLTTLALAAAAFLFIGPVGLRLPDGLSTRALATTVALTVLAVLIYWTARRLPGWPAAPPWNMRLQAASVAVAAGLVLPIHLWLLAG